MFEKKKSFAPLIMVAVIALAFVYHRPVLNLYDSLSLEWSDRSQKVKIDKLFAASPTERIQHKAEFEAIGKLLELDSPANLPQQIPVEIVKDWNWKHEYGFIRIQGVVNPDVKNKMISAAIYGANGEYIGNGLGVISNGGTFSMSISAPKTDSIRVNFSGEH